MHLHGGAPQWSTRKRPFTTFCRQSRLKSRRRSAAKSSGFGSPCDGLWLTIERAEPNERTTGRASGRLLKLKTAVLPAPVTRVRLIGHSDRTEIA
jgi:hypothetical protein